MDGTWRAVWEWYLTQEYLSWWIEPTTFPPSAPKSFAGLLLQQCIQGHFFSVGGGRNIQLCTVNLSISSTGTLAVSLGSGTQGLPVCSWTSNFLNPTFHMLELWQVAEFHVVSLYLSVPGAGHHFKNLLQCSHCGCSKNLLMLELLDVHLLVIQCSQI